jgi:ribosomal protein S12 methylthiotransferase
LTDLVEQLTNQRAEQRIGERVEVLVEEVDLGLVEGRAEHQGPEVDGTTRLVSRQPGSAGRPEVRVGELVAGLVVESEGVDLVAERR